jgi:hypothetical protein
MVLVKYSIVQHLCGQAALVTHRLTCSPCCLCVPPSNFRTKGKVFIKLVSMLRHWKPPQSPTF